MSRVCLSVSVASAAFAATMNGMSAGVASRILIDRKRYRNAQAGVAGCDGRCLPPPWRLITIPPLIDGAVAQLGERRVRNAKVEGSIPFRSTNSTLRALRFRLTALPVAPSLQGVRRRRFGASKFQQRSSEKPTWQPNER